MQVYIALLDIMSVFTFRQSPNWKRTGQYCIVDADNFDTKPNMQSFSFRRNFTISKATESIQVNEPIQVNESIQVNEREQQLRDDELYEKLSRCFACDKLGFCKNI